MSLLLCITTDGQPKRNTSRVLSQNSKIVLQEKRFCLISRSSICAFSAYRQISGYEETCFKFVGGWVGYQMRKHGKVVCDWCEVVQNTLFRRRGGGYICIGYSWLYERRVMRSLGEPRRSGGECEKTYRLRRAGSG